MQYAEANDAVRYELAKEIVHLLEKKKLWLVPKNLFMS